MEVKLISITDSLIQDENDSKLTPEQLIVYVARVSNPGNQTNMETADGLIRFLIRNKHWSPFELVDVTVEIKTSRAIAQQILRHRSFSFQEFSQRYAAVTDMEPVQLRKQAEKNRQSSTDEFDPYIKMPYRYELEGEQKASFFIEDHIKQSEDLYKRLIDMGVAKECARMILPLTTQTTIYMKGSVRSWIHYFQIRCDEHTQLEHREIANAIRQLFNTIFPNISKALNDGDQK